MKIKREKLLETLLAVEPALDSSCVWPLGSDFSFFEGEVFSYNTDVLIRAQTEIDFVCSVRGKKLVKLLRSMEEEDLGVELKDSEFLVTGSRTAAGMKVEEEAFSLHELVEEPGEWSDLPAHFLDAVAVCSTAVSKDRDRLVLTCLHLTENIMEAADGHCLAEYEFDEEFHGWPTDILFSGESAKMLSKYDPICYSLAEDWIHFLNENEVTLSMRLVEGTFPNTEPLFKVDGHEIAFPEDILSSLTRTKLFTGSSVSTWPVEVSLSDNRMQLRVNSDEGWIEDSYDLEYDGEPVEFRIQNKFLESGVRFVSEGVVGNRALLLQGDCLQYVISLCLWRE